MVKYLRYSHVGIQFFLSVGVPTGLGVWLDQRLGTGVLLTILGLVLGFTGGVYALYHEVFPAARKGAVPSAENGNSDCGVGRGPDRGEPGVGSK